MREEYINSIEWVLDTSHMVIWVSRGDDGRPKYGECGASNGSSKIGSKLIYAGHQQLKVINKAMGGIMYMNE